MTDSTTSTHPQTGPYRHMDGGMYRLLTVAKHTDTLSPLCVYEHLWPFEPGQTWARPLPEWAPRFTPITQAELTAAMAHEQKAAQTLVIETKNARRAKKA